MYTVDEVADAHSLLCPETSFDDDYDDEADDHGPTGTGLGWLPPEEDMLAATLPKPWTFVDLIA